MTRSGTDEVSCGKCAAASDHLNYSKADFLIAIAEEEGTIRGLAADWRHLAEFRRMFLANVVDLPLEATSRHRFAR